MKKRNALKRNGFTLVEIVVAVLLLATAGAVLLPAFANLQRYNSGNPADDVPPFLIARYIEGLYEGARADWWNTGFEGIIVNGSTSTNIPLNGINYVLNSEISSVNDASGEIYKKVKARLSWTT